MAPTKAFKSSRERKAAMQALAENSVGQGRASRDTGLRGASQLAGNLAQQQQLSLPGGVAGSSSFSKVVQQVDRAKLNTPTKKPYATPAQAADPAGKPVLPAQANGTAVNGKHDEYEFVCSDPEDLPGRPPRAAAAAATCCAPDKPKQRGRQVKGIDRGKRLQQEHVRVWGHQDNEGHDASGDENDPFMGPQDGRRLTFAAAAAGPTASKNNLQTPTAHAAQLLAGTHEFPGRGQARPQQQVTGGRQLGIQQFTRKVPLRTHSLTEPLPAGMLNHGNTCYLNAILQALLSLPCLAHDLSASAGSSTSSLGVSGSHDNSSMRHSLLQLQSQLPPDGVTAAMQKCLRQHQAASKGLRGQGSSGPSAISPADVRNAMQKRASHWGAARQEDAHEFFTALLDGLSHEVQQAQLEAMKAAASSDAYGSAGAPTSSPADAGGAAAGALIRDSGAAAAALDATAAAAEPGSSLELPPSADDAAQAEPQQSAVDASTAAPRDRQQQAQQQGQEDTPAAATANPAHTAGDVPPLSAGQQAAIQEPTPGCQPPMPARKLPSMPVSQTLCPVTRNFVGCLQNTFTCTVCGHQTICKEQFNHLSLDLPADDDRGGSSSSTAAAAMGLGRALGPPVAPLSALLANFFTPETCEKACEGCGAAQVQHRLEHAIRRLPRVLVVQLKRFKWVESATGLPDCRKVPTPVQPDQQLFLGRLCVPGRPAPPLLAELMPQRMIQSALEAAGERPPQQQQQQQPEQLQPAAVADSAVEGQAEGIQQQQQQQQQRQQEAAAQPDPQALLQPGQQRVKPQQSKRLPGLRPPGDDALHPHQAKKPKMVAGQLFGARPQALLGLDGALAEAHDCAAHLQGQRQSSADLDALYEAGGRSLFGTPDCDADTLSEPSRLQRNNSSSGVPQVDLTDLADAAVDDEYERQLQEAIALSLQAAPPPPQQQRQQQDGSTVGPTAGSGMVTTGAIHVPDWISSHTVAPGSAAPPGSPADLRCNSQAASDGQGRPNVAHMGEQQQHHKGAAWGSLLGQQLGNVAAGQQCGGCRSPQRCAKGQAVTHGGDSDAAAFDGCMLGLSPELGGTSAQGLHSVPAQQQQQDQDQGPSPMDIDVDTAGPLDLGPASPALAAPRADRSGLVSSSRARGGPRQRLQGAEEGAAAALRMLNTHSAAGRSSLLREVQEAGLTEDQQLERALAESLQERAAAGGAKPAAQGTSTSGPAAAAAAAGGAEDMDVVMGSDVVEDEDAIMQRVLQESAAEHQRHQQQKLQEQQQAEQDERAALLQSAAAAAAADAAAGVTGPPAGAAAPGSSGSDGGGSKPVKEKPPALLLRLLEDSDYEAEQQELENRRTPSSSTTPGLVGASGADVAAAGDAADAEAAGNQQPAPTRRTRRQALAVGGGRTTRPSAAAKKRRRSAAAAAAAATAGSDEMGDAVGQDDRQGGSSSGHHDSKQQGCSGTQLDKENVGAAAACSTAAPVVGSAGAHGDGAAAAAGEGSSKPRERQRRVLGDILGSSSSRNVAAGTSTTAGAAADPLQKPPAVAAAVAAARAAAAAGGSNQAAAAVGGCDAGSGGAGDQAVPDELQELQGAVAAGAVSTWPQEAAASYSLTAVVRHMGDLVSVGHFTSDVLNAETQRWYHYDDSRVEPLAGITTVARTCQRDGYLFFYINDAITA